MLGQVVGESSLMSCAVADDRIDVFETDVARHLSANDNGLPHDRPPETCRGLVFVKCTE